MRGRMRTGSKAGRIWNYPTSAGRRPRRAHGLANTLESDRAGFEPRRGSSFAHRHARPQMLGSRRFPRNVAHTQRLKSGADSRLDIAAILGAPRFSPYRFLTTTRT